MSRCFRPLPLRQHECAFPTNGAIQLENMGNWCFMSTTVE